VQLFAHFPTESTSLRILIERWSMGMSVLESSPRDRTLAAMVGDREALRAIWEEHRRWLAAVLLAYKPRHVDLEDLLQNVAMSIVRNISSLRDPDSLKGWLRTTAINAAREAARADRLRRRHEVREQQLLAYLSGESSDSDHTESAHRAMRLVEALHEDYREPLLMRAVQGMSTELIGEILGLSAHAVHTRISRARAMIRDQAGFESGVNPP
jgi:RNA polymerase sigma-70 factor (ECF subfamily)